MNINYNKVFLKQTTSCSFKHNFCKTFEKYLFKPNCCLMSSFFLLCRTHIPNTLTYKRDTKLNNREQVVLTRIGHLFSAMFISCQPVSAIIYVFVWINLYFLSFFIIVRWKPNYTSEWVRSTSLTRQSFWFVFIHVEI